MVIMRIQRSGMRSGLSVLNLRGYPRRYQGGNASRTSSALSRRKRVSEQAFAHSRNNR